MLEPVSFFAATRHIFCYYHFFDLLDKSIFCYHRILILLPPARKFATCDIAESRPAMTRRRQCFAASPSCFFATTNALFCYIHERRIDVLQARELFFCERGMILFCFDPFFCWNHSKNLLLMSLIFATTPSDFLLEPSIFFAGTNHGICCDS